VDAEVSRAYSVDARGDDTTGSPAAGGPDDEDALSITGDVVVRPGSNYTLPPITCNAAARGSRVAGWIDWNANGTFDANERSNVASCAPGAGTVSLTFAVPNDALPNGGRLPTFVRSRSANTVAEVDQATGVTTGGEVEDHRIVLTTDPRLEVVKQVGSRVSPADQFTVAISGAGLPAGGASGTTSGTQASATTGTQWVQPARPTR